MHSTKNTFLKKGWNTVIYSKDQEQDIRVALISITGQMIICKDKNGRAYMPHININTIGVIKPGKEYRIKMASVGYLVFY